MCIPVSSILSAMTMSTAPFSNPLRSLADPKFRVERILAWGLDFQA